jgi:hypothetical protein
MKIVVVGASLSFWKKNTAHTSVSYFIAAWKEIHLHVRGRGCEAEPLRHG